MASTPSFSNTSFTGPVTFGDHSPAIQNGPSSTNAIQAEKLQLLASTLTQQGLPRVHLEELQLAIGADRDAPELAQRRLGPRVWAWWERIVRLSREAEIGIASSMIAAALGQYYGWPI